MNIVIVFHCRVISLEFYVQIFTELPHHVIYSFRANFAGLDMLASRCGATLAPLLMTLVVYLPILPWIIYGVFPIVAGLLILLPPETKNLPIPDTIQDVENKWVNLLPPPGRDCVLWICGWERQHTSWVPQITGEAEPCLGYSHLGPLSSWEARSFPSIVNSSLDCWDPLCPVLIGSFSAELMVISSVMILHPTCPHEKHTFILGSWSSDP